MNTIYNDATDAELIDALLTLHIAPALDLLDIVPFETPDPKPNELLVVIDAHNNVYARITLDIIRE